MAEILSTHLAPMFKVRAHDSDVWVTIEDVFAVTITAAEVEYDNTPLISRSEALFELSMQLTPSRSFFGVGSGQAACG